MTTMELNLRKEYLYDLIKGMDEITMTRVIIYAFLLLQRITHATELLITNPLFRFIAEPSLLQLNKEYRSLIEGHYKIIYSVEYDCIRIYQIFDTRQLPDKLMDLFR